MFNELANNLSKEIAKKTTDNVSKEFDKRIDINDSKKDILFLDNKNKNFDSPINLEKRDDYDNRLFENEVRYTGYNTEIGKCNKEASRKKENEVEKELKIKYPDEKGYKVLRERELLDENGKSVKDNNGDKRRLDFVVVDTKKSEIVDVIEVTSKTADKTKQLAKENEIKNKGGNYIKDKETNKLYKIPKNMETRIERRD